jgi:Glyoxalase-like domain
LASPHFALDHLVVATRTLEDGVGWCESFFGVTPCGGGKHELMGTHNRLFSIASAEFSRAYCELIAIDPSAAGPARRRWFGLDDSRLQQRLAREGPQLVHWVARTNRIQEARAMFLAQGIDPGVPTAISRGVYRWYFTLRDDGIPQGRGAVPSLIQWDSDAHPSDALPEAGIALLSLGLGDQAAPLHAALGNRQLPLNAGVPAVALCATLSTPRGERVLAAK